MTSSAFSGAGIGAFERELEQEQGLARGDVGLADPTDAVSFQDHVSGFIRNSHFGSLHKSWRSFNKNRFAGAGSGS